MVKTGGSEGQVWITLGVPLKGEFQQWCTDNGYHPRNVFLAGWAMLRAMSHDERVNWFKTVGYGADKAENVTIRDGPSEQARGI